VHLKVAFHCPCAALKVFFELLKNVQHDKLTSLQVTPCCRLGAFIDREKVPRT